MPEAYLVDAVRTPVGRRNGALAGIHPVDLAAHSLRELVERTGIDSSAVDDVILGCLDQIGPQAGDIARTSWLAAGLAESVPGTTIDRQCGSSQQAIHFAAQAVMSGTADLVVAGGVQHMSAIPLGSSGSLAQPLGFSDPLSGSKGWTARYGGQEVSQFNGAEMIARNWDITRADMEAYSYRSHQRAIAAMDAGYFAREIAPIEGVSNDEGPRRDTSLERMAGLKTLAEGGRLTAAVSSQISDGSAAVLVASERALAEHGLTPRARVHHLTVLGADPIIMLDAPIPATARALERTGLTVDDIDLFEINEAFASVVLAWQKATGAPDEKVNVNGGAIALGHPLGASGARIMTTLLNELDRTSGRFGLQVMCEGGGQANVTIVERLG
jgi:acetyl-CoA C-acetyltransferase